MRTLFITACLILFSALFSSAQKTTIWNEPAIESEYPYGDGYFKTSLQVTKVELKANETVVYITINSRSDYNTFGFAKNLCLIADGKRYPVISADGIELDTQTKTGMHDKLEVAFHFQPLPPGTKSFDFIESEDPGAYQIKGIKPAEERSNQFFPSYWRNDKTGNWEIAFFEDCAVYQCKFWKYRQCSINSKTGKAEITMYDGKNELKVSVGKNKKGKRTIRIGKQELACSMITGKFLPPYPTPDTRTGFADTGYKTDTVTVCGWIKDMPEECRQDRTFNFGNVNPFDEEEKDIYANLDSMGRFTIKIPVINSSEFFCDWGRCFVRTILEPGKTYFLLYDFKEGRRLFMGDDSRLQNELFKYPIDWNMVKMQQGDNPDKYIASADSIIKAQHNYIDSLCRQDPSLSNRFRTYRKDNTLWQQAYMLGQARFYMKGHTLTDNARKYAYRTFWTKLADPITLHRETNTFIKDFISDHEEKVKYYSYNIKDHIKEYASNEEEAELLKKWIKITDDAQILVDSVATMEEKQQHVEQINAANAELIKKVDKIINSRKGRKINLGQTLLTDIKSSTHLLDSLNAIPSVRDIFLFKTISDLFERENTSLNQDVIDTIKTVVKNPIGIKKIEETNNRYIALENREFNKLVLKSSDNLKDISEGKTLLKEILKPFKGKYVLLDVWGTWCSPCKEALSHSTEEYNRLSKYNIAYIYLANNSSADSWENVIKEYNVSGDNVAHYNLPQQQQAAIERYLNVHSFPTYKLFDPEGNLLDLKVDARDLDQLDRLLGDLCK